MARVIHQIRVEQGRGDVGDRSSDVARNQLCDFARLAGETPHAQRIVQEQGRNVRAIEQVLHVVVDVREFVHFGLQFVVDRLQFLVHGLHLFFRGGQFFVGGLEFLVGGLHFLVGGFEFFLRGLHFLANRLHFLPRHVEFAFQLRDPHAMRWQVTRRGGAFDFGRRGHIAKDDHHHSAQGLGFTNGLNGHAFSLLSHSSGCASVSQPRIHRLRQSIDPILSDSNYILRQPIRN